jgi:predicted ATPase/DNA-binding XRE family transcriptional regulator
MNTTNAQAFGELLRGYRTSAGLTQEALAELAGVSVRGISDLERGARRTPYRSTIRRLAEGLGLGDRDTQTLLTAYRPTHASDVQKPAESASPLSSGELDEVGWKPGHTFIGAADDLIGRDTDLASLEALLKQDGRRLVTIVGPGGCGKTRLALAMVERMARHIATQAVDLTPVRDAELVPAAIAHPLGVIDAGEHAVSESLIKALRTQPMLLLLDNFEHVLGATPFIADLLNACSELVLLVTSREPLRLRSEWVYPIDPLAVPRQDAGDDPERLMSYSAVSLFVTRARAHGALQLTPTTAGPVAEICRRLDGLPLAIELAAARAPTLGIGTILSRLGKGSDLLRDQSHERPARHQSLDATIAWSYDLLTEPERALFRRVSVFRTSWTLEAAEAICSQPPVAVDDVIDLLGQLVQKSLVALEERPGSTRYRLLETLHDYAASQLRATAEEDATFRGLLDWSLAFSERANSVAHGPQQAEWLAEADLEHDNLRAALDWAGSTGAVADALCLASRLGGYWELRGHLREGRGRLSTWLEQTAVQIPERVRADALVAAAFLAFLQGDHDAAIDQLERAVQTYREVSETSALAWSMARLGIVLISAGRPREAVKPLEDSIRLVDQPGPRNLLIRIWAHFGQAQLAMFSNDLDTAQRLLEESLTLCRDSLHNNWGTAVLEHHLGRLVWLQGNRERALALERDSLCLWWQLADRRAVADGLEAIALFASSANEFERAARLFGAAEAARDKVGAGLLPYLADFRTPALARVRAEMDSQAFERATDEGRAMTMERAVADALR